MKRLGAGLLAMAMGCMGVGEDTNQADVPAAARSRITGEVTYYTHPPFHRVVSINDLCESIDAKDATQDLAQYRTGWAAKGQTIASATPPAYELRGDLVEIGSAGAPLVFSQNPTGLTSLSWTTNLAFAQARPCTSPSSDIQRLAALKFTGGESLSVYSKCNASSSRVMYAELKTLAPAASAVCTAGPLTASLGAGINVSATFTLAADGTLNGRVIGGTDNRNCQSAATTSGLLAQPNLALRVTIGEKLLMSEDMNFRVANTTLTAVGAATETQSWNLATRASWPTGVISARNQRYTPPSLGQDVRFNLSSSPSMPALQTIFVTFPHDAYLHGSQYRLRILDAAGVPLFTIPIVYNNVTFLAQGGVGLSTFYDSRIPRRSDYNNVTSELLHMMEADFNFIKVSSPIHSVPTTSPILPGASFWNFVQGVDSWSACMTTALTSELEKFIDPVFFDGQVTDFRGYNGAACHALPGANHGKGALYAFDYDEMRRKLLTRDTCQQLRGRQYIGEQVSAADAAACTMFDAEMSCFAQF